MRPLDRLVSDPAGERLLTLEPAIGGGGPRNIGLRLDFDGEPAELGVVLLHPSVDASRYQSAFVLRLALNGVGS